MRLTREILKLTLGAALSVPMIWAQFTSGSTGADGAYSPTASGDFDPIALSLNAAGDNIFNFTTINIPANVTIKLRASKLRNKAVTWLATGNVTIAGILDLSGANAPSLNSDQAAQLGSTRVLPEPGPGGYTGGLGSRGGVGPQAGAGPGGGPAALLSSTAQACVGGSGSFINSGQAIGAQKTGPTYGSYLLVPLYGGSGGGGGWDTATATNVGGIGGAGGGGLRIASTTQISVSGTINASGGNIGGVTGSTAGCAGGPGAGGAIHLVAPAVAGTGSLIVNSGVNIIYNQTVVTGIIRLSTNTNSFTGTATGGVILGPLYLPPANSTLAAPSLSITQVNGVAVPAQAAGQYLNPDVIISAPGAVTVNLAAANIPLTTVPSLRVTAETGPDTLITCTALTGTVAASTSTCTATFPFSISIAGIRATW